ncbi:MAG: peptide deformylase [Bacteroidales bacterium]|nr:peptide deformylase [Bacteroidales bacterium]
MYLPIYIYGSEVLRKKSAEVDVEKEEGLQQFMKDMYVTMKHGNGIGLAAPQVGKSLRIVVIDADDMKDDFPECGGFKRFMINPVITEKSDKKVTLSEGCLSVPKLYADVERAAEITVEYLNEKYEPVKEHLKGFACRVTQHELDHLDGHLFIDRVSPIRKKLMHSKLKNIEAGRVSTDYKIVKK